MSEHPRPDALVPTDGRDLDPRLADASGIASGQRADPHGPDRPLPGAGAPGWDRVPSDRTPGEPATYYEQPIVKAPPWGAKVSAYIVLGGVAGSSAALAAAGQLLGGPALAPLVSWAAPTALATGALGAGLLAADLGRPERALHMVRVVKPTSVMNVGGYLLSITTGAEALTVALRRRGAAAGAAGRAAGVLAGASGIPLAGYTGVLLAATAIPGWNAGIRTLPALFMASGAATAASGLRLAPVGRAGRRTIGVLAVLAQAAELAAEAAHERALADRPRARAFYGGSTGWRAGRALTAASLALGLLPTRRRRPGRLAAAALGVAGSVTTKVAVFDAGIASARDPRAVAECG